MKAVFLILFSFLLNATFSQLKENNLSFAFTVSAGGSTGLTQSSEKDSEKFRGLRTWGLSGSLGVKALKTIKEKHGISVGLTLNIFGDRSLPFPPDPMRGFFNDYRFKTRLFSLELPLLWRLHIRNNLSADLGFATRYNFSHDHFVRFSEETEFLKLNSELDRNLNFLCVTGLNQKLNLGNHSGEIGLQNRFSVLRNAANPDLVLNVPSRFFMVTEITFAFLF